MDDYDAGYADGKEFAQNKVDELLNEVIEAYEAFDDRVPTKLAQINAVKFMRNWVRTGGITDFEGERACLPW